MDFLVFILMCIAASAIVSFPITALVRSNVLAIVGGTIIAEALCLLYILASQSSSPYPDMAMLGVNVTLIFGTPVFVASSIGFTFLARRVYRRRNPDKQP